MREITEIFEVKGKLTESSLCRYPSVTDQYLFQQKSATFAICDMNVFLPIVSCLFFLQPSPPKSFCWYWDRSLFFFLWLNHLSQWHKPISKSLLHSLFQAPSGSPCCKILLYSLSDTNLLSSLSSEESRHSLDSLCYSNCSLLVVMSNSLIQLMKVIFLQFCLDFFQAGSPPFSCIWLPSSSVPRPPNSSVLVAGQQQGLIDVLCFCWKWKSFSAT